MSGTPTSISDASQKLIGSRAVRHLCGNVSVMALYRWLNGEPWRNAGAKIPMRPDFPKPAKVIGGRRFWRESEVISWLAVNDVPAMSDKALGKEQAFKVGGQGRTITKPPYLSRGE